MSNLLILTKIFEKSSIIVASIVALALLLIIIILVSNRNNPILKKLFLNPKNVNANKKINFVIALATISLLLIMGAIIGL